VSLTRSLSSLVKAQAERKIKPQAPESKVARAARTLTISFHIRSSRAISRERPDNVNVGEHPGEMVEQHCSLCASRHIDDERTHSRLFVCVCVCTKTRFMFL
jgi:hypothetical protein